MVMDKGNKRSKDTSEPRGSTSRAEGKASPSRNNRRSSESGERVVRAARITIHPSTGSGSGSTKLHPISPTPSEWLSGSSPRDSGSASVAESVAETANMPSTSGPPNTCPHCQKKFSKAWSIPKHVLVRKAKF